MRVTHIGKFYPPVPGGMERVLQSLCEGERERGIDSRALVASTGNRHVDELVNGVPVMRAASLVRAGSVWFAPSLITRLRSLDTDILVLHEPNPMALLAYALARPRQRLIVWYHSEVLRARWRYKLFYEPFLSSPLRRATRIIVSSPALAEQAAALAPFRPKCEVIPYGLDVSCAGGVGQHPSVRDVRRRWTGPVALFVGRLVRYKGVEVLLRALRRAGGIAGVIVGDGPLCQALQRQAHDQKLTDRVFFPGHLDDEGVSAWFSACDVFVLPSVTRAEAFGLVQVEAMARGKPVISTRLESGVPWVNVDGTTGFTVPPDDDESLATALERLTVDADLRRRMGEAGRARFLAEFTRERMVSRTVALYSAVITEPRPVASAPLKRAFDATLAAAGLVLSAPVWLLVAALIKLEDRGPVFFHQQRVGQNGRLFTVFKFRSMVVHADRTHGPLQARADDPRITRVGRLLRATAMDELPQLLNIFKGDMSFVGPRALLSGEIEVSGDGRLVAIEHVDGYRERTAVQPGLTGIAQIYAPRDVTRRHKFR